jgi:sterol desaturase/sphingolipid hydroxylase (fatty acid hydroxylase superfamily)
MDESLHYLLLHAAKALSPFMQRDSYLYWPFVVSALAIAAALWRRPWRDFWREYFAPEVWWHRSAQADYWLYFANALLIPALFAFVVVDERQLAGLLGFSPTGTAGGIGIRIVYTVVFFFAYDFGRFAAHCLLHDVPALWEFHKIHHSAEVLTPMTTFRAHPVELLLMSWGPLLTTTLVTLAFNAALPGSISVYSFLGWHVAFFAFNLVDNLRHSPVWLSYGSFWGRWLVSPAHHQLHHSCEPRHFGRNRGFELAIWDRMYGTLYVPGMQQEKFRLGLGDGSEARYHRLDTMYFLPFATAARELARRLRTSAASPPEAERTPPS